MIFGMSGKTAASAASTGGGSSAAKGRVLVVDDVAENREILSYYLTKAGYQVVTADDGFAAVEGLVGGAAMRRGALPQAGFDRSLKWCAHVSSPPRSWALFSALPRELPWPLTSTHFGISDDLSSASSGSEQRCKPQPAMRP